jgi:toxin ParE1/3/4
MARRRAEYRLSPKARDDIEAAWLYSLNQWGLRQAERYIDELTKAFALLARSPNAGLACDWIRRGYRRHAVIRHVVYYRVTGQGIEIVRVLPDRALASRHL